jgi:hypothetical protein
MSEYQYYEFQSLERVLSAEDKKNLRQLSSRVELTASTARFVYSHGDLPGEPIKILDRYFDLMLYVANFGVRRLMLRLPKQAVDSAHFTPYGSSFCLEFVETESSIVVDIHIAAAEYYEWISEEEGRLAAVVPLRDELLRGDLRLLYLAWLRAGYSEDAPEPKDLVEPPVPPNLDSLSPAQQAFVELFVVDPCLVAAAALASAQIATEPEPLETWLAALPEAERMIYLLRVVRGESQVGMELLHRLRQLFAPAPPLPSTTGRTLADLAAIADQVRAERTLLVHKAEERARLARLAAIAPKQVQIWQEVFHLVELKQAKAYDEAVAHLMTLREVAVQEGTLDQFRVQVRRLRQQCRNRPGVLSRLDRAGLPG